MGPLPACWTYIPRSWTCRKPSPGSVHLDLPNPQDCAGDTAHSPCSSIPIAGPTPRCTNPAFRFLPWGTQGPPPLGNTARVSIPRLGLGKSGCLVPLPTPPAPEALSERRKTCSKRLPKYQSAAPSPGEESFSSPAEAAVNKHGTCFISCQGCPLLSTDLTPAPRWERRQEPEAHQQQALPPLFSGSGAQGGPASCEAMADGTGGEVPILHARKAAKQIPALTKREGILADRPPRTTQAQLPTRQL